MTLRIGGTTRLVRLSTLVGLAMLVSMLAAAPAAAHAELVATDPSDGAVRDTAPSEVLLRFNEPVEPPPEPVRVFDAAGERVDAGDGGPGADPAVLRVSLPADLPYGAYVVAWRAISADTHLIRGSFTFVVGAEIDPSAIVITVPDDRQPGWESAAVAGRWLTYAGTLLAVGGAIFLLFVHGRPAGADQSVAERRRLIAVIGYAAAAGAVGTLVGLPLQAVVRTGAGGQALFDQVLLAGVIDSAYGGGAMLRLTGLAVLFVGVIALGVTRWAAPAAVGGALAALGSFWFAGHTFTGEPRAVVWLSNLLHSGAAAVWFGGLVLLALVLHTRRRAGADPAGGAAMVARFSTLATVSVLIVAVAGMILAWTEIPTLTGLTTTSYGWLLLAKIALVAMVVAVGGYNRFRLVPAIVGGLSGAGSAGAGIAWRRLSRTVRLEAAVIMVGVLAVTAVLVATVPGRTGQPAGATGYDQLHPLGDDYQLQLVIAPAQAGPNELKIRLRDQSGDPVALDVPVELRFSLPGADIARITREPVLVEPGNWRHLGPELSIAGDWEIEIRLLISDFERLATVVEVPIATGFDHDRDHHP